MQGKYLPRISIKFFVSLSFKKVTGVWGGAP